jgi:AraC-like DNA-binding protein
MGAMQSRTLVSTDAVIVSRVHHGEEPVCKTAEEEVCDHYCVNFVESGEFGLAVGDRQWRLRRTDAFTWHPQVVHRYVHFAGIPADACLSVRFRDGVQREIEREGWLASTAGVPVLPASNRLGFLRLQLEHVLESASALALESWTADIIEAIARPHRGERLYDEVRLRQHARRIDVARERMLTQPEEPHTLASLAASAGLSPFHFARVFRSLTGTPPHRFLRDVRLDRARRMLLDGESVTTTCYAVGFGNLSHFIRSFGRRFGVPPSLARKKAQAQIDSRSP